MKYLSFMFLLIIAVSCESEEETPALTLDGFFAEFPQRSFPMGFTSWPYGPDAADVADTYQFISQNADVYAEHIDNNIPWSAWMNDSPLPESFVNEISFKKSNLIPGLNLLLSVSVLNIDRNDLASDFNGSPPTYTSLDDAAIVEAYTQHVDYLIQELRPAYLVISIEGNELLIHSPELWEDYKRLMVKVRAEIASRHPSLRISESFTLHNLYQPGVPDPQGYIDEVVSYANQLDYVAISFYPFFKNLSDGQAYQDAFDFLHSVINKPIAFAETSHIAEDLIVPGLNLNIAGTPEQQDVYLQTLLTNAQQNTYEYVIWWAHRDFDRLWQTFPIEVKDLGQLWRDTGLIDESGNERPAYISWSAAYQK